MEHLRGHDPFDALRGKRVPKALRASARGRQAVIQVRKRLPIDISGLLGIEPFVMAKAAACFLSGVTRTAVASGDVESSREAALALVSAMHGAEGNLGSGGWGYEFDVQTRWAYYPAGSPNLIATAFVGQALLEAGTVFGQEEWLEGAYACAGFLVANLFGSLPGASDDVFRYTPETTTFIHNANLLAAGLVASVGILGGNRQMVDRALCAALVSTSAQDSSGRWLYGAGENLAWCDNFHTAYNLLGLCDVARATGDSTISASLDKGIEFWVGHLFEDDGAPRYFDDRARPYDVHSGATAVDAAARLAQAGYATQRLAAECSGWMRANLVDASGAIAYQKRSWFTDRRRFVRWGDAHWSAAEGSLALLSADVRHPLDARVECARDEVGNG